MRAMQLGNYFIAGCIASSLLGWIASLHPMAQKAIVFLVAATTITWCLGWLLDYSLSNLLKIEIHALHAHLVAIGAMFLIGGGIYLCS